MAQQRADAAAQNATYEEDRRQKKAEADALRNALSIMKREPVDRFPMHIAQIRPYIAGCPFFRGKPDRAIKHACKHLRMRQYEPGYHAALWLHPCSSRPFS